MKSEYKKYCENFRTQTIKVKDMTCNLGYGEFSGKVVTTVKPTKEDFAKAVRNYELASKAGNSDVHLIDIFPQRCVWIQKEATPTEYAIKKAKENGVDIEKDNIFNLKLNANEFVRL